MVLSFAKASSSLISHSPSVFIREGNDTPLQYSCLENPRDRGAWWAAVCGVTQSRTWLKWLSSGSMQKSRGGQSWARLELVGGPLALALSLPSILFSYVWISFPRWSLDSVSSGPATSFPFQMAGRRRERGQLLPSKDTSGAAYISDHPSLAEA